MVGHKGTSSTQAQEAYVLTSFVQGGFYKASQSAPTWGFYLGSVSIDRVVAKGI